MLNTILQASAASSGAPAQGNPSWMTWGMMLLVFVVMWLFMIRPQRKQQKALEEMRRSLKKGDKVVTAGGIYGIIVDVDERTVLMRIDDNVKIRVDKTSVQKDMSDPSTNK